MEDDKDLQKIFNLPYGELATEEEAEEIDENDDYELKNIEMGRKEEKDISDRLRKMVGKCKRIYSQADKGNASIEICLKIFLLYFHVIYHQKR